MLRPLEALYLVLGVGILVHGVADHGLTVTELGATLFLLGMIPASRADRAKMDSPAGFIRTAIIAYLSRGGPPSDGGPKA